MSQVRMTKQRTIILEELRKMKTHPTADEIYDVVRTKIPRISLGTVYRNLDFLVDTGTILRLDYAGNTKRFDGDISWHQHVRCTECGCVGDIMKPKQIPDIKDIKVEGFAITKARIEYDGICEKCSFKNSKKTN